MCAATFGGNTVEYSYLQCFANVTWSDEYFPECEDQEECFNLKETSVRIFFLKKKIIKYAMCYILI